jgi:hypothetical protein
MDYFIGWDQTDLETELRKAQKELAAGKTITGTGAGDTNTNKAVQIEILARIEMILAKLSLLDPVTYPPASVNPTRVTKIAFA